MNLFLKMSLSIGIITVIILLIRKFLIKENDMSEESKIKNTVESSREAKNLNPILKDAFDKARIAFVKKYPLIKPILTQTTRSETDQEHDYSKGRTVKGLIVTNAKAGQSPHNYFPAMGFDMAFIGINGKPDWNPVHFKNFSNIIKTFETKILWGGDYPGKFKDAPHFEIRNWKSLV